LRITNQIRVLIQNKDSTNIRLGVVVTEDINTTASNKLRTSSAAISQAPRASVMNPLGTIYGGTSTVPEDKRLKLEIYYTKPINLKICAELLIHTEAYPAIIKQAKKGWNSRGYD
jgi:hypothetical protein